MDYKDTLNLPQTSFKMRGGLLNKEPLRQQKWKEEKIYQKRLEANQGCEQYLLHDGPPYANGNIHMGHALNKILKDYIVRYKAMQGYYTPYIPGWDTHGLPIETAVTKQGVKRKELSVSDFRKICEEYAKKQIANQKESFERLSLTGDWNVYYQTFDNYYEKAQIEVFAAMVKEGLIFKGLKPIYWSPSSESALAEAEIEYHNKKSPSIFVKFQADKNDLFADGAFVIWTTTPWTLPANMAVAVNKEFTYSLIKSNYGNLILASELVEKLVTELELEEVVELKTFKGHELEGLTYQHPFLERTCQVILGEHVSLEAGSGLVHTAPGHGEDDFIVGQTYGLEVVCPVDEKGFLTAQAGRFANLFYDDANKAICEFLENENILLKFTLITHSYPHDWRTKKPIIFRATPQWFASIDKIREKLLNVIDEEVNWNPNWAKKRIRNMIEGRGDWCISRQRVWGVPLPIFYDEQKEAILDEKIILHVAELFGKHGSGIWYEWDVKDLLPKGYENPNSPNGIFTKEKDIMDVWFDSGSSHYAVLKEHNLKYPAQLYVEGSDQFRGWFNSSLITGVATTNKSPYETVFGHGFTLDAKGYAMSKSLGNSIDPMKMVKQFGAEIVRLWVSNIDYSQDHRVSVEILEQVSENYRKLRNTFRYLSGNTHDLDEKSLIDFSKMNYIDKYMMIKIDELISKTLANYDNFMFQNAHKDMMVFVTTTLSNFYLDYAKDILYVEHQTSPLRRGVQTVLYYCLESLMKLLYPILPHTMDELYEATNLLSEKKESCFLEEMPKPRGYDDENVVNVVEKMFNIREDVLKILENARISKLIGKSLEAKLLLNVSAEQKDVLAHFESLEQLFIVSKVEFVEEGLEKLTHIAAAVERYEGNVCPRCWNIYEKLENEVCLRCNEILTQK